MTKMGAISCCIKCKPPERHPGCHSKCEKYLKEAELHKEYLEKVRKGKAEEYAGISEQILTHTRRRGKTLKKGQP